MPISYPSRLLLLVPLVIGLTGVSGCDGGQLVEPPIAQATSSGGQLIHVRSSDGTTIAVECSGTGPTLLFVHGGVGDRTRWTPMFPFLSSHFTTCAMDRRGHGASGDSVEYSLRKEAEDVAAVVDSRPGAVFVLGHSYGGVAALEATFLTSRIAILMLYEPPVRDPADRSLAVAAEIEAMIRAGDLDQALVTFQAKVGEQSPSEIAAMRERPSWPGLVATIAAHPRQMRALAEYRFDAARMKTVKMPTLLLIGETTASRYMKEAISDLRASLPNATLVVLKNQQHNAMDSAREDLATAIIDFAVETGDE